MKVKLFYAASIHPNARAMMQIMQDLGIHFVTVESEKTAFALAKGRMEPVDAFVLVAEDGDEKTYIHTFRELVGWIDSKALWN